MLLREGKAERWKRNQQKKFVPPHTLDNFAPTGCKAQASSHGAKRASGQAGKAPPTNSGGPAYDQQLTELKLLVDSLENVRYFYFSKLWDIDILCVSPEVEHLLAAGIWNMDALDVKKLSKVLI